MEVGKRNFHDPNLEARVPDDENGYCLSLRDSIGGDVNWEVIHLSLCCGDRNFSVANSVIHIQKLSDSNIRHP